MTEKLAASPPTETVLGQSNTDPYAEDHRELPGQYRPQ